MNDLQHQSRRFMPTGKLKIRSPKEQRQRTQLDRAPLILNSLWGNIIEPDLLATFRHLPTVMLKDSPD
jgi:hypothetical protein